MKLIKILIQLLLIITILVWFFYAIVADTWLVFTFCILMSAALCFLFTLFTKYIKE